MIWLIPPQSVARSRRPCTLPTLAASSSVLARLWVRAGPVPTAESSSASILPWSRERGAARSAQRESESERARATEDGRSGIVRSGPGRVHHRPDYLRQAAADHPQSAVLGESGFSGTAVCVWMCVCVCMWGGGGGGGGSSLLSLLRETRDVFSLQI